MRIFVIVVLYRPRAGGRQKVRSSYRNLSVNFGCVARHVRLVCLPVVSIFTLHFLLTTLSSIRPWLCTESHYLFSSTALYGITTRTPHSQHSSTTQWRYEFCRSIRRQSRLTWHTGERECRREKLYTSALYMSTAGHHRQTSRDEKSWNVDCGIFYHSMSDTENPDEFVE